MLGSAAHLLPHPFLAPPCRPADRRLWLSQEAGARVARAVDSGPPPPLFATRDGVWYVWAIQGELCGRGVLWCVTLRCFPDLRLRGGPDLILFMGPVDFTTPRRIPIA